MINILGSEDYLEDMHLEDMDEVSKEKTDSYTKIKGCLKEYASIVLPHLFKESAQFDAKYNKALSYPAHVITAVFAGSILYIYDRISTEQPLPNSHDIRLLCTALTLHDVNKYWNEITDSRYQGNYYKLIQDYFELDPFNLKAYFPEWANELDEIAFLIQHTEENDVAGSESRFSQPKFANFYHMQNWGIKSPVWGSQRTLCKR